MMDLQSRKKNSPLPTAAKAPGKIVKWEINEEQPHQLKVDCNTALELFFLISGIVLAVIFLSLIVVAIQEPPAWPYVFGILGLSLAMFLGRIVTDNYYVLDKHTLQISLYRSFAGFKTQTPVGDFNRVFAVMPVGTMVQAKTGTYWQYHLAVLLRSGRFIRLSDASPSFTPRMFTEPGSGIATWLGVPFIPGREKEQVRVISKPVENESCLQYRTQRELQRANLKLVLIIVAVSLLVPFGIIWLLTYLDPFP